LNHKLVCSALALTLSLGAVPAAAQMAKAPNVRIDYVEDSLPNGLKLLYHVDRATPVAAVVLWYNVGSVNEEPGRTGFAHLFEHMMFKGSSNVADGEHMGLLARAGARVGADINGTTSFDRTNYFEQLPSNQLELALWLEADRMATLLETLTNEKFTNQQEVVKNEKRQSYDNQPYGVWLPNMLANTFPDDHPYHHIPIGSMRDLTEATTDDVKKFFRTYYAPNNAVLVVAGDIDIEQTKQLVRKHFSAIPRGPAKPKLTDMTLPKLIGMEQRIVLPEANAPSPAVFVAYRVPPQEDSAQADVVSLLGSVLVDGRSGKLYRSLVREQQIATQVFGGNLTLQHGADVLFFAAIGKPGASPDSLERALLAELEKGKTTMTKDELDRVRAGQRFSFIDGLQTTGGFGGRADRLAEGWTYYRNPNYVNTVLQRYDAVTVDQLTKLAAERFVPMNRLTMVFVPERTAQPNQRMVP
jgi:zinc protease